MIQRFEDLIAWRLARELTREVYACTREGTFARVFGLAGQMQRAAVSITSNIAEGFERKSLAERRHFYIMAKASCAELRSQCYIALDVGHVAKPTFTALQVKAERVSRLLSGLRAANQNRQERGKESERRARHTD